MITFLCSKKEAAAGGANFKPAVWNALIVEMAPHLGPGAHKTTKACKSKYGQLWSAYSIVSTLKGLSGFGERWDDGKGMNIGVGEVDAWNAYCMKHDKAKAYTHKGFPLYNLMSGLMPILGRGTHAFRPLNQTQGASSAISTMVPEPLSNDETTANTPAITPSTQSSTVSPSINLLAQAPPSENHELPPPSPPASIASSMPPPQQIPHAPGPLTSSTTK